MEFQKYQHIERFGTMGVEGIEIGTTYVFPKIDGTNGSMWKDNDTFHCGSRNRVLTIGDDNAGFLSTLQREIRFCDFFKNHPNYRLFGEWLVPHTLKTYREDVWRKFYVFDVIEQHPEDEFKFRYLTYEEYQPLMEQYEIDYIPCLAKFINGTEEAFIKTMEGNTFLIKDGEGIGEGIVIKNYNFINRFGQVTWAKIVNTEFKDKHTRDSGPIEKSAKSCAADRIVDEYCTTALIEKTYAKIVTECDGWDSKFIPRLLNTVYHDLIVEESWNFVKKFKNPYVDYKRVQKLITAKIKEIKPELF